ncbi:MAG: helix-turn-helix transcriptional regulator [Terriglobia bacterium]
MNTSVPLSPAERRVLDYLKQAGSGEVSAMARSLRVTPMAVRHHLAVLEKAGLVRTALRRRGVGRPRHVYSLSVVAEAFFPKEYGELASSLIRTIAELDGERKVVRIFKRMKESAVARYAPRMAGKSLPERVAEMAKIMTEAGYMAEWDELDARSFQITEHNCAISCVAQQCHHACECELEMLQELLKAGVSRREHIVAGDPCCRYLVHSRSRHHPPRRRKAHSSRVPGV